MVLLALLFRILFEIVFRMLVTLTEHYWVTLGERRRSSAAHGKAQHEENDLLDTFNLLRRVLMDIIDDEKVATKDELEARLFGCLP